MHKTDLVKAVALRTGLTEKAVKEVLNGAFATISDELIQGGRVEIDRFGIFETVATAPRVGRNPRDPSKTVQVPAGRKAKFRASTSLKALIQARN